MTQIKILSFENDNINPLIDECFKFSLMYENFMNNIERFYLATIDDEPVGFLAQGYNNKCILIEVKEEYRRRGIGTQLVEASKAYRPSQDGCPEFWEKFEFMESH
jgi:GNAT superfamily N-acetyltransferase